MKKLIYISTLICVSLFSCEYFKEKTRQDLGFGWFNHNENCSVYDFHFQKGDSLSWEGNCSNGKANGLGILKKTRKNNLIYEFKGNLVAGIKFGTAQENGLNGSTYNGNFYYDFHGRGIYELPNSEKSDGIFNLGTLETGIRKNPKGNITYFHHSKEVDINFALRKGFVSVEDSLTFIQKPTIKPEINKKLIYYYDNDYNLLKSIDKANFYRILTLTSENFPKNKLVQDFYLDGAIRSKYYTEHIDVNYPLLDVFDGTRINFYKNGNPADTINYIRGRKDGASVSYSKDGILLSKENYSKGKIENKTQYYISGNIKSKQYYVNEQENDNSSSNYSEYYDGGKKRLIKKFENENEIPGQTIEYLLDGSAKKVYRENFYFNQKKWVGNSPGWDIDISKNLIVDNDELTQQIIPINYDNDNEFSIQIELDKIEGENLDGSGIIFNYIDNDNYMKFIFSSDGSYSLLKRSRGVQYIFKEWTPTSSIEKANIPNKLKIIKHLKRTSYYINNQLVLENSRALTSGNKFGFVADQGKYILKEFKFVEYIKELEPEPEPEPEPKPEPEPEPEIQTEIDPETDPKNKLEEQIRKEIRKELIEKEFNKKSQQKKIKAVRKWNSSGSGIVISIDGMIATNYHVVKGAKYIGIELENDKGKIISYSAEIIKVDVTNDLAVVKINDSDFKKLRTIKYNYSSKIKKTGAMVYALGFPYAINFKKLNLEGIMGKEMKFTDGRISARTGIRGNPVYYQTSVPIQPGNSGGPLFDSKANLIGITSSKLKASIADNVSYSIKSIFLENLVDVIDEDLDLPSYTRTGNKSIENQIEILRKYVAIIKVVK